jgi:hypothetical protein
LKLLEAVKKNDIESVKIILNNKHFNPSLKDHNAFIYSFSQGYFYIFQLLIKDYRINHKIQNNFVFIESCKLNEISIIKLFIENNIYNFKFDFNNYHKVNYYFLKEIYIFFIKDVNKYLNYLNETNIINELNKNNILKNINSF